MTERVVHDWTDGEKLSIGRFNQKDSRFDADLDLLHDGDKHLLTFQAGEDIVKGDAVGISHYKIPTATSGTELLAYNTDRTFEADGVVSAKTFDTYPKPGMRFTTPAKTRSGESIVDFKSIDVLLGNFGSSWQDTPSLLTNLISLWEFESGSVGIDSHSTWNATGSPTVVAGKIGGAMDATTGTLYIPDYPPTPFELPGPFSVGAWIYLTGTGVGYYAGKDDAFASPSNRGWGTAIGTTGMTLRVTDDVSMYYATQPYTFSLGTWYHIGMVFDATNNRALFYVNGAHVGTQTGLPSFNGSNGKNFTIGGSAFSAGLLGRLDQLAIWNRVVSGSEFATIAQGIPYGLATASIGVHIALNVAPYTDIATGTVSASGTFAWKTLDVTGLLSPSTQYIVWFERTSGTGGSFAYPDETDEQNMNLDDLSNVVWNSPTWDTSPPFETGGRHPVRIRGTYTKGGSFGHMRVFKSNASALDDRFGFVGFAYEDADAGYLCKVDMYHVLPHFSGLTAKAHYFLSNTSGVISTTPGTIPVYIGSAKDATTLVRNGTSQFMHSMTRLGASGDVVFQQDGIFIQVGGNTTTHYRRILPTEGSYTTSRNFSGFNNWTFPIQAGDRVVWANANCFFMPSISNKN